MISNIQYGIGAIISCEGCIDNGNGRHVFIAPTKTKLWEIISKEHILPTIYIDQECGHRDCDEVEKLIKKRRWKKAVEVYFEIKGRESMIEITEDAAFCE